ncbi:MAG: dihydropteroate synthase [Bryobacteraceae bacterium]|nr:dihydropteroate synthase [Bryobacteraceae bacterium]
MPRKLLDWKLRNESWRIGERTLLVGVLNVTPDSIYDEGRYQTPESAYRRAMELCEQGADLLEIGAESFRAGATPVSEAEELRRLVPVLKLLRGKLPVPLIVETAKSAVAEKAVEYGAQVLKDPTGLVLDPEIARVANESGAALILQHMRGVPAQWAKQGGLKHPAAKVHQELAAAVSRSLRYNIPRHSLVIDPGLGLGKRKEHNTDILVHLDLFTSLEIPLQISPTGKPFQTTPQIDTGFHGAIAAAVAAILRGVHLVRTHDVPAMRAAALVADQFLREGRDMSGVHDTRTAEIPLAAGDERKPLVPPAAATPTPAEELPLSKRPIAPRPPRAPRPEPAGDKPAHDPRDTRYIPPPDRPSRDDRDSRDTRSGPGSRPPRDPRDTRYSPSEGRPPRPQRDSGYSSGPGNRPPRDPRDSRDTRSGPGSRPPRDPRDTRYSPSEGRPPRPPRDSNYSPGSGSRPPRDPRDPRYSPENRPPRDSRSGPGSRPPRDNRYSSEDRPPRDPRGPRPPFGSRGPGPKGPRGPRGPRPPGPPRGRR